MEDTGQTAASKIGAADRQIQCYGLENRLMSENQCQGRKTRTAGGSVWTTLRVKNPGCPSHRRAPKYCEIYLQELNQVLTGNIREKSHVSGRRRRKGTILIYSRAGVPKPYVAD